MDLFPTPQEALTLILGHTLNFPLENISITTALNRIIHQDIITHFPQPPFDKSAMDGFAYHSDDLSSSVGKSFHVHTQTISAGQVFSGKLAADECLRIMTGAPIPSGCNAVHRLEFTRTNADTVTFTKNETSSNIIFKGQNQAAGSVLLGPRMLKSMDIALLASAGIESVDVVQQPKVGIISTGDELLPAGQAWKEGFIYDSNSYFLSCALRQMNIPCIFYGIVKDNEQDLKNACTKAFSECDIVLFSGGVSMGDFDLVPGILADLHVRQILHKVRLKPGKPLYFGRLEKQAVFGFPGNPVSNFVCFELFIKPYLYQCMGIDYKAQEFMIPMAQEYTRKEADREEYLCARLGKGQDGQLTAETLPYRGSSMLSVLAQADILIRLDIDKKHFAKGELVHARLISERN